MESVVVAAAPSRSPAAAAWRRLVSSPVARAGLAIVCGFALMAVVTPIVHHYEPRTDSDLVQRLKPPTHVHPLGPTPWAATFWYGSFMRPASRSASE